MKHRHYLSLLLWLLIGGGIWAGPVSRKSALKIAARYVQIDESQELRQAQMDELDGLEPAYHVFNDKDRSGFVIVSGEEALPPVIGYADEGRIDLNNLPIQLATLLQAYEARIQKMRLGGRLEHLGFGGGEQYNPGRYPQPVKGPLVKTKWNQEAPYNLKAPAGKDGKKAPTGCAATALSQLMYFHAWPETGRGKLSYQPSLKDGSGKYYYPKQEVDFSKSKYDWKKMKHLYLRNVFGVEDWSKDEGEAVALLMRDAGVALKMQYAPEGSGAFPQDEMSALETYFDYDTRFVMRDYYNNAEIRRAIKAEFDLGYPIVMNGASLRGGGHAWIIDGYDDNGMIHANWGWGGVSDGYFELDFMDPPALGTGGGDGRFNRQQSFVFARPNRAGLPALPLERVLSFIDDGGLVIEQTGTNWVARQLNVSLKKIGNIGSPSYVGMLAIGLYNEQGHLLKTFTASDNLPELKFGNLVSVNKIQVALDPDLADGRYTLEALCTEPDLDAAGEYRWARAGRSNRVILQIKDGQLSLVGGGLTPKLKLAKQPRELVRSVYKRIGSTLLTIENESARQLIGSVAFVFQKAGESKRDTIQIEPLVLYDYAVSERAFAYNTATGKTFSPGQYEVSFCFITEADTDEQGKVVAPAKVYPIENPFGTYRIELHDGADQPILEYWWARGQDGLDLYLNGILLKSDLLDLASLKGKKLEIATNIRNYGKTAHSGALRYRLLDAERNVWHDLGKTSEVKIGGYAIAPRGTTKISIDQTVLANLRPQYRYEMHVEAEISGTWVDVWSANYPRRYISILGTNGHTTGLVEEANTHESVHLYPNPSRGSLSIEGLEGEASVEIFTLSGLRLHSGKISSERASLELSHLPSGVYVLRLTTARGVKTYRWQKL